MIFVLQNWAKIELIVLHNVNFLLMNILPLLSYNLFKKGGSDNGLLVQRHWNKFLQKLQLLKLIESKNHGGFGTLVHLELKYLFKLALKDIFLAFFLEVEMSKINFSDNSWQNALNSLAKLKVELILENLLWLLILVQELNHRL